MAEEPFIGEIRIFPFDLLPRGWTWCDGKKLSAADHQALFQVLGTTYGGDEVEFALPDLRGRVPMQPGQGPGLSPRNLGETGGTETVPLKRDQMPVHNHFPRLSGRPAVENDAAVQYWAVPTVEAYSSTAANPVAMAEAALSPAGEGEPHNNMQPYLTLKFAIALQGIFPGEPAA